MTTEQWKKLVRFAIEKLDDIPIEQARFIYKNTMDYMKERK